MTVKEKIVKPTFSKESLLKSERYKNHRDVLNALLKDDAVYTLEKVDNLINSFLKKEVK